MKALRLHGEGATARSANASQTWKNPRLQLEDAPVPSPRRNELLVRVRFCGLCGSDFHLAEKSAAGDFLAYPGLAALPVTIGHEFSGVVEGHGEGTEAHVRSAYPVGSLVTAEEMQWCGECATCRAGHVNHCENLEELGFTTDGAHAEFVVIPAKSAWSLAPLAAAFGEADALRLGALVEPYAVSFRALFQGAHRGAWLPGGRILVIGAGPIGLAAMDLALNAGALAVDVIEREPARLAFAKEFGAEKCASPAEASHLSGPYDWVIDAAGAPALATELAERHLGVGGTLCLLARTDEPMRVLPESLITRNARIVGSQGHAGEATFQRVIALLATGRLRAKDLIRETLSLKDAAQRLARQEKSDGKILVRPEI